MASDDEEDAWALESDDDDFAVRQRMAGVSLRAGAGGSSSASSGGGQQERRHAPPARPHPFPLPTQATPTTTTNSGWTIVSDAQSTTSPRRDSRPHAGSPPTDVGSTAAEAVLEASMLSAGSNHQGQQRHQQHPPLSPPSSPPAAPTAAPTSSTAALDKKRDKDASAFLADVRPRVLDIVRDPFVALECLVADQSSSRSGGDVPPTPLTAASASPTPTTAHQRQAVHTQNLGRARGFDELRTPVPTPAPQQRDRSRDFDAVTTMAGDGFTLSGSGWGSSSLNVDAVHRGDDGRESAATPATNNDAQDTAASTSTATLATQTLNRSQSVRTRRRWREFFRCLGTSTGTDAGSTDAVDVAKLRELSWNGIPTELRPVVWPLLLGYLPLHASVRSTTLARKRQEYCKAVQLAFGYDPWRNGERGQEGTDYQSPSSSSPSSSPSPSPLHTPLAARRRGSDEEKIWHQISIDVPRTNPGLPLWQRSSTQRCLERLLYVWAIRHHATGYVQGMSDLATPFFQVFLSAYLVQRTPSTVESYDVSALPLEARIAIEADTYFCLGKLLDGIQENYIFAQPGIQRQVRRMEELVARIDAPLHAHLKNHAVEYIQFAFRWMNCLLMREMSVRNVTRLWDTYLAEGPDAFSDFHLYVCSVFLCKWSETLRGMDFQGCIMFLQSLPTQGWSDKDAELLLSEAFVFKNLFGQTRHLGD